MFKGYKNFLSFIFAVVILLFLFTATTYSQDQIHSFKNGGKIRMGRGKTSAIVKGVVGVNGEILYGFRAKEGQRINLRIKSVGNKAKFVFYAVRGDMIATDETTFSGDLPEAYGNDYVISVTTKANRSNFTLEVFIK